MEDFALVPLPAPLRIFTSKQSNSLGHFSERKDFFKINFTFNQHETHLFKF